MLSLILASLYICVILLSTAVAGQSVFVHKQVGTWEEAKNNCESEGAILASPLDAQLLKYMKSIITVNNHTTPYFIGIKANLDKKVQFVSQEGVLLEDIPDALDLVEQLDTRNGGCLCMDGHSIRVVPCWTRLPYICFKNVTEQDATTTEIPATITTEIPTTALADCNTGYQLNSETGSYYKFYDDSNTKFWTDANFTCAANGGYLVILNNTLEAQIVKNILIDNSYSPFAYIGLMDFTGTDGWRSIHGDPIENLYNVFSPTRNRGNCGALRSDVQLVAYTCYDHLPFVCEKQILNPC